MFDIGTTVAYYLCSQVEAGDGLEIDGNFLFRPLPASQFIALELLGFSASETTLIDKVWKFLLHEVFYFLNCLFEAGFGSTRDV